MNTHMPSLAASNCCVGGVEVVRQEGRVIAVRRRPSPRRAPVQSP